MEFKLGVYKHTKSGNYYHCYDTQLDSEDISVTRVSYQGLYGEGRKFSRPAEMFGQRIAWNEEEHLRFVYICTWEQWITSARSTW